MNPFPQEFYRQLIPNGRRRAPWHDYYSRSIYMVTLNKAPHIPPFSNLTGIPGNHDFKPRAIPTETGKIIASTISSLKESFPFIKILRRVIMPDHIHFVIFITEKTEYHLGEIIRQLKSTSTSRYHEMAKSLSTHNSANTQNLPSIFEDGYHDRILLKKNQLQKMLKYVSDNPLRRLERMQHSGFHHRAKILDSSTGTEYETYGNLTLLEDPDIEAVKISRRYTHAELRNHKLNWLRTIENCGVLVSPFISENEKKVRNWAMENNGRLIIVLNNGLGPRFSPKGQLHDLCTQGRLLLVAPLTFSQSRPILTRESCTSMNDLAKSISEGKIIKLQPN